VRWYAREPANLQRLPRQAETTHAEAAAVIARLQRDGYRPEPNPESEAPIPEPAVANTAAIVPEHEHGGRPARLDALQARADQAAHRIAAGNAARGAREHYTARRERQAPRPSRAGGRTPGRSPGRDRDGAIGQARIAAARYQAHSTLTDLTAATARSMCGTTSAWNSPAPPRADLRSNQCVRERAMHGGKVTRPTDTRRTRGRLSAPRTMMVRRAGPSCRR
jgi:hypothetical protein